LDEVLLFKALGRSFLEEGLKRRSTSIWLHVSTSQKALNLIFLCVETTH